VHVTLTRQELRRLAQRGIHLPLRPADPRPTPPSGVPPGRLLELERAAEVARAEARSLAVKLARLEAERAAESAERGELADELLDRERRIAEMHAQNVYWQHHARRAQAAVRYAGGPLRAAVGAQVPPAPAAREPEPAARGLTLTTPLQPLPARVLAEVHRSLEQTASDPRPWLSPERLSRRARERWIAGVAILAVAVPVVTMTSGARGVTAAAPASPAALPAALPLPARSAEAASDARLPYAVASILAELLAPRLRTETRAPSAVPPAARRTGIAAPAGETGAGRALAELAAWHLRATRAAAGRHAGAAESSSPSAVPEAVATRELDPPGSAASYPATPLELPPPPPSPCLEASATQRNVLARACREERGARLAWRGWTWPLPGTRGREWLVAFPVLGGDLEVGPIGLWWWRGDRHDPEADVRSVNEQARAASVLPGDLAPRADGAAEGAELLVLWTGIAQRLGPERGPRAELPLFRASGDSTLAVVRPGRRSDVAWSALAARVLAARGRSAGTVEFAAVASEPDGRGWTERPLARVTFGADSGSVSISRSAERAEAPGSR